MINAFFKHLFGHFNKSKIEGHSGIHIIYFRVQRLAQSIIKDNYY
jgi:hypothetical protein